MIHNDLSPLEDKFKSITGELFLEWEKALAVDYPALVIDLKDKNALVMDVKEIVDSAITEIEEKKEELKSMFSKTCYFHSIVQEELNKCWHFNYVFKQTNEFKIISLLRTIGDFLEEEPHLANIIKNLYTVNILEETNFTNFDPGMSVTNAEIMLEMEYPEIKRSGESKENSVIIGIKNIYAKIISELDQFKPQMYIPKDIHDYFLSTDVENLLILNIQE